MLARARLRRGLGWAGWVALAGLIVANGAGAARGQTLLGVDPYQPYTMGYTATALPPSPVDRFSSVYDSQLQSYTARSNEMGAFYDQLNGASPYTDRFGTPRAPGSPEDQKLNQQLGRSYQRNPGDAEFYADQERRTREYFEALAEKDPKKRAAKLKALREDNLRAARSMAPNPKGTARRPGQPATAAATPPTTARNTRAISVGRRSSVGLGRQGTFTPVPMPGATVTPGSAPSSRTPASAGSTSGPSSRVMGLAPTPPPIMPITGRSTPSDANRARVAPPANTSPRSTTTREETPSEILDRSTRSNNNASQSPRAPSIFDPPR